MTTSNMVRARPRTNIVGILGGSGVVGRSLVRLAQTRRDIALRLGARTLEPLSEASAGATAVEIRQVDVMDPNGLRSFCEGCGVVVNCAGPSYQVQDRVAQAALSVGSSYIDVSGDDPAHAGLASTVWKPGTPNPAVANVAAVLSAGMIAGLSNTVPRWLARHGREMRVTRLTTHLGGAQRFSSAAAGDLVLSLNAVAESNQDGSWYGETGAAWRSGGRKARVLRVCEDVTLAHFRGPVTVQPFLSSDAVRLATRMGLAEMDWFNVYPSSHLRTVLSRRRGRAVLDDKQLDEAVREARAAAELDLAGRDPFYTMVFALSGFKGGAPITRTAVVHTEDSYELTAGVAFLTLSAFLDLGLPPGLHYADDILEPERLVEGLERLRVPGAQRSVLNLATYESRSGVQTFEDGGL